MLRPPVHVLSLAHFEMPADNSSSVGPRGYKLDMSVWLEETVATSHPDGFTRKPKPEW